MNFLLEDRKTRIYWNPYFGGFMLGLIVLFSFYVSGRGIGASGGVKSAVVASNELLTATSIVTSVSNAVTGLVNTAWKLKDFGSLDVYMHSISGDMERERRGSDK